MRNSPFPRFLRQHPRGLALFVGCCIAVLVAACDSGMGDLTGNSTGTTTPGGGTGTPAAASCSGSCGASVMTMTDAAGDFLSYIVTLTSLQLQTASGASVETLPAATPVDFTKLVNLTEVLSAGQIPAADYVSAQLTLSFANAQITASDAMGNPVTLSPVDAGGNALTGTLTVTVQLDNTNQLVITPGNTGRLAFDFNLAASNMVNLTAMTVQVAPTLVASVVPSDTKQVRVRGQLASVSAMQNDFVVNVQPFAAQGATAGQVTAQVSTTTTYQINGTAYVGAAGLTALAALPANTLVAAFGSLQTGTTPTFTATNILAGTSLQSPSEDQISGTVIARTANALTVRGATWTKPSGNFGFERMDSTVNVGANTAVTAEGQMGAFTAANISVGQHIDAFGTASQGANGAVTLDATAGQVQLDLTPLWGTVTAATTGSLTLNLQSLDGIVPSAFTFAGTGTNAAADAVATGLRGEYRYVEPDRSGSQRPGTRHGIRNSIRDGAPRFHRAVAREFCGSQCCLCHQLGTGGIGDGLYRPDSDEHFAAAQSGECRKPALRTDRPRAAGSDESDAGAEHRSRHDVHRRCVHYRSRREAEDREFQYFRGVHHATVDRAGSGLHDHHDYGEPADGRHHRGGRSIRQYDRCTHRAAVSRATR